MCGDFRKRLSHETQSYESCAAAAAFLMEAAKCENAHAYEISGYLGFFPPVGK